MNPLSVQSVLLQNNVSLPLKRLYFNKLVCFDQFLGDLQGWRDERGSLLEGLLVFSDKILMDVNSTGVWRRHCLVPVQYLTDIPAIQPAIFDGLRGKGVITQHRLRINQRTGRYILRVVARNQAGVGPGNTVLVDFEDGKGWCENIQFKPKSYSVGGVSFEELPEVEAVQRTYCTHWAEKFFISDHGDAPKVRD